MIKTRLRKFYAGAKVDFEAVPPEEGSGERARMVRYIFLISIPHIYSSYFLISITHIFPHISSYLVLLFPDISSYFLMWGAGEDGQIYISSVCSSANTNWDHNFDKESSWSWINNPLDGVDGQLCKAGYIFPLTSADTKWDKKLSRSWSLIK